MKKFVRQIAGCAALLGAAMLPLAQASTVIDFEGDDIAGLYFPGDSFSQGGYTMTANYDFGTVGTTADFVSGAPTGNASQFFFNSNDGYLSLQRDNGEAFSLDGFSAAFVPLSPPVAGQTTVIVAYAITSGGDQFGTAWLFGSSATNNKPFVDYNNPADFADFTDVVELQFFACVYDNAICATPTLNNGQFALDNVMLTAVPEPSAVVLMSLGLLGLALRARQSRR